MPMDRSRYPKGWDAIATFLKALNNWHCAECGKPCRRPGETREDLEHRIRSLSQWSPHLYEEIHDEETGEWGAVPKLGRFTLTVAHLDHDPPNCDPSNLLPLCSVCHCRYDITSQAMARKLQLRLEHQGQLRIPGC